MKFIIKHEIRGRLRVHIDQQRMSCREADTLLYYLHRLPNVTDAKVYERTGDAAICYTGDRQKILAALSSFQYAGTEVPEGVLETSGRELNAEYQEKLVMRILMRMGSKLFIPYTIRAVFACVRSIKYIRMGLDSLRRRKLEVSVLDATAISVSLLRRDMNTASSVMFLLGIGELLEEWTHKKSVGDLARSMSLNVSRVWLCRDGQEILVSASEIRPGIVLSSAWQCDSF